MSDPWASPERVELVLALVVDAQQAAGCQYVMVRVADARAHCERARANGARILTEPADYMYGERQDGAEDFAGHRWTFTESLADVDPQTWGGQYLDPD